MLFPNWPKMDLSPRQDGHFKRNWDYKPFWSLKIIKIKFKIWSEDDGTGLSFRFHKKSLSKCSIICNLVLHHFMNSTKITSNNPNDFNDQKLPDLEFQVIWMKKSYGLLVSSHTFIELVQTSLNQNLKLRYFGRKW